VVTAGHCADPDEGRKGIIEAFLNQQINDGLLTEAEKQNLLPDALVNWKVEGQSDGSNIDGTIKVEIPPAVSGLSTGRKLTANVMSPPAQNRRLHTAQGRDTNADFGAAIGAERAGRG
jgi:serine protease Do